MPAAISGEAEKKARLPQVPAYLIKEVIDGIPVYYKGYREVLSKNTPPEAIMAAGLLHAMLKMWLSNLFYNQLKANTYWVFSGEVGSHISHKNNMAHDLVVFEKSVLPPGKITGKYADVPARVVVEIDTEIEYGPDLPVETYVHRKTQNTLDFGTEKVIWIFTASRKIMVATAGADWLIRDWDKPVEVLDGISFNVAVYLEEQGIRLEPEEEA